MRARGFIELPELHRDRDVTVAARLDPESGVVRHVVQIQGGTSSRETARAMATARARLAHIPEELREVEVALPPAAHAQILAADAKRKRRAERDRKIRERLEQRPAREAEQREEVLAMARAAGMVPR